MQYPDCQHFEDILELTSNDLQQVLQKVPHANSIFIIAGSPCQDVSGLNYEGEGVSGERSSLVEAIPHIITSMRRLAPHLSLYFLIENVQSMDAHGPQSRRHFAQLFDVVPIAACASSCTPAARPRYHWLNWPILPTAETTFIQYDEYTKMVLRGTGLNGLID